jgi:hypothetical protein
MSKNLFTIGVHFQKIPESWGDEEKQKEITSKIGEEIINILNKFNSQSETGWASGYVMAYGEIFPFGETAICDKCKDVYLLWETDFQETEDGLLLCRKCQESRGCEQ